METGADPERKTLFAEVLVPVPVAGTFTYRVPFEFNDNVQPFLRVLVPFGARRLLTGVILQIHETPPIGHEARLLLDVLDPYPLFYPQQIRFFQWMADYYLCTAGEVLQAGMPSGLKLSSESLIQLHPGFNLEDPDRALSTKEQQVIESLKADPLTYTELSQRTGIKNIHTVIKSLRSREAIIILEEIREKYQPKRERRIRFTERYCDAKNLELLFKEISKKPKQEELVLEMLRHLPVLTDASSNSAGIAKSELIQAGHSDSTIATMVRNGVLEAFDKIISRFGPPVEATGKWPELTGHQKEAQSAILEAFADHKPAVLFGITGSGKTEVYISLIRQALDSGNQALLLLPEIALTTQIVSRLRLIFGGSLGVYHSRFSDNERVESWLNIANGKTRVIVGVRSSVFLPFENLGLVIIDEEHDSSYKQDRSPRYHGRDAAIMLAKFHHAQVLLGSGTPSAESFYHVRQGNFRMARLTERFGDAVLPEIIPADLRQDRKFKRMRGSFSPVMISAMEEALAANEQIILFQNRRGYSPTLECQDCGHVSQCMHCSVSLTYHQYRQALICHYCGYRESIPKECPSCRSKHLVTEGPGTEKIEEEVRLYFPNVQVQRMDLDTTRSKTGHERILEEFGAGRTQILIGTQMVTKGLDFDRVALVGVFDADRMFHFPDFRSHERAFQILVQVSGRAGRRKKQGKVVIQTSQPGLPAYGYLTRHETTEFMDGQLTDRQIHQYPPYSRLVSIQFRHVDKKVSFEGADLFARQARKALPDLEILGPGEPSIGKVRNEFLFNLLVKIPRNHSQAQATKPKLNRIAELITVEKRFARLRIVFDVDPLGG